MMHRSLASTIAFATVIAVALIAQTSAAGQARLARSMDQ
jgi:hypothetical protein